MTYPAKILAALHQVMAATGYVQKTSENKFHNYKYVGEAALLASVRPEMLKAGLMLIPSAKSVSAIDEHGNTTVTVEYTLAHKDGDVWPEKICAVGTGNDRNSKGGVGDKGTYKAITGANKYMLFKLLQIETGDDPEIASEADHAPAPARQTFNENWHEFKAEQWKEWATSARAAEWYTRSKNEIRELVNKQDVGLWQSGAKKQLDALEQHAPDRFAKVMDLINERLDALTNRAA